jgi:hypothetical protein
MGRIREAASRATSEVKSMVSTPSGWAGIVVANALLASLWAVPFALGLILGDGGLVMAAGAIAAFMALPVSFAWLAALMIASAVRRTIDYMLRKRGNKE